MNGGQGVVGLGAVALVVANQVATRPLTLSSTISGGPLTTGAERQWSELAFEAIGVIVLVVVAGIGDHGVQLAGAVLVGLWLLFLIHYEATHKKKKASAPAQKPSKSKSLSVA